MTTRHRSPRALATAAILSVGVAVIVRWWHRGAYYPGWDVIGAAHGLHLVSTKSVPEVLAYYRDNAFGGPFAWNVFGIPVALIPGMLAAAVPWEFWPHVWNSVLVATSALLLGRAVGLGARDAWLLCLCWGASPAMLSYAVSGFPYASNALPYGLALWVVFRWRAHLVATVALSMFTLAVSWHVQELGRTVFLVFGAAALFLPGARLTIRCAWLAAAGLQGWLASTHHSFNTSNYAAMSVPDLATWPGHLAALTHHLVIAHHPDLPLLLLAGAIAALLAGRARWFWLSLIGAHLGLVFLLSANTGPLRGLIAVWPRRILLLDFLCAGAALAVIHRGGTVRRVLLAVLLAGNLWQIVDTLRWGTGDLDAEHRGWAFTLPYTDTPLAVGLSLDSMTPFFPVDWYHGIRREIDEGRKVFLIYNFSSYDENATSPAGIIDRLYIALGHERFHDRVAIFGGQVSRWGTLPIRPLHELASFVDTVDPREWVGHWLYHPYDDQAWPDAQTHRAERAAMVAALERRFDLQWTEVGRDVQGRQAWRFTFAPR